MVHELKILPNFLEDIIKGIKTFEVRFYDRPYMVGDYLLLKEYVNNQYTGRFTVVKITYIFTDEDYVKCNYCILGIELVKFQ